MTDNTEKIVWGVQYNRHHVYLTRERVIKETEHFYTSASGARWKKESTGAKHFNTFEEAKEFALEIARDHVEVATSRLSRANGTLYLIGDAVASDFDKKQ